MRLWEEGKIDLKTDIKRVSAQGFSKASSNLTNHYHAWPHEPPSRLRRCWLGQKWRQRPSPYAIQKAPIIQAYEPGTITAYSILERCLLATSSSGLADNLLTMCTSIFSALRYGRSTPLFCPIFRIMTMWSKNARKSRVTPQTVNDWRGKQLILTIRADEQQNFEDFKTFAQTLTAKKTL